MIKIRKTMFKINNRKGKKKKEKKKNGVGRGKGRIVYPCLTIF